MGEKEWMNDWMNSIIESNSTRTGNEPEKKIFYNDSEWLNECFLCDKKKNKNKKYLWLTNCWRNGIQNF